MLPPAPPRFSTTTGCPMLSESFLATMRESVSAAPPGANPTSIVIGRLGKSDWARAGTDAARAAMASSRRFMVSPDLGIGIGVEAHRDIAQRFAHGGVALHDERIVAGDDVARRGREGTQRVVAVDGGGYVEHG